MKTEGNVIHHDFGRIKNTLPQMSFTCEVLFADEHAKLLRLTYRIGEKTYLQHIASGVGLDAEQ